MKSRVLVLLLAAVTISLAPGSFKQAHAGTIICITENEQNMTHNCLPRIKGNLVVWQARGGLDGAASAPGDWEIFLYGRDNRVIVQVTDDDHDDVLPQTDGAYVVWQKHDTSMGNQVFLYEVGGPPGGTMISDDDGKNHYAPKIAAGRVAWTSRGVGQSYEPAQIMLYDAKNSVGPYGISDSSLECCSPRISSESVMWVQSDGAGGDAFFTYSLTAQNPEPNPAPEGYVWPDSPQTDGGMTILTRHDGHDREIFVYNETLGTCDQITQNEFEDRYPSISGKYVSWMAGEDEDSHIYLTTTTHNHHMEKKGR